MVNKEEGKKYFQCSEDIGAGTCLLEEVQMDAELGHMGKTMGWKQNQKTDIYVQKGSLRYYSASDVETEILRQK